MLEGKGCKRVPFANKCSSLAVTSCTKAETSCCKAVTSCCKAVTRCSLAVTCCCKALLTSVSVSCWNCSRSILIVRSPSTICCLSCCSCSCCCCCCCCCCSPWPSILWSKVRVKYERGPCTTLLDTEERRIFLSVLPVYMAVLAVVCLQLKNLRVNLR